MAAYTAGEEEGLLGTSLLSSTLLGAPPPGEGSAGVGTACPLTVGRGPDAGAGPGLRVSGGHVATPHPPLEDKQGNVIVAYTPTRLICTTPCATCKIGWFGSFILFVNTIIGPGILAIPWIYATAGLYPTTFGIFLASIVACYAVMVTCEVVRRMPNNATFTRELAFCDPIEHFIGPKANRVAHWFFFLAMLCQTVATISPAAQTLDEIGGFCFGRAWALVITGSHAWTVFTWNEAECDDVDTCEPFFTGDGGDDSISSSSLIISAGYCALCLITMPFCQAKLDQQMGLQVVSFVVLVVTIVVFVAYAAGEATGFPEEMPDADWIRMTSLPGTIIFNFMYTVFVTAWLSEKAPSVDAGGIAKSSALFSGVVYVAFGSLMAVAFGTSVTTDVATLLSATTRPTYVRVASYAFGLGVLVSGIPVNIIITRDNLLAAHLSRYQANALAMVLPWGISWIVYESTAFGYLVDMSGLLIIAPLALVVPFVIYLAMQKAPPDQVCPPQPLVRWAFDALRETDTVFKEHATLESKRTRYTGGWRGLVAWTALLVVVIVIVATIAEIDALV